MDFHEAAPLLTAAAQGLAAELRAAGIDARAGRAIVNCCIEVRPVASRGMGLLCIWDTCSVNNSSPGRRRNRFSRLDRDSPQLVPVPVYRVTLYDHGREVGYAGTRIPAQVVACARSWLAGDALDQLDDPFADRALRRDRVLNALAKNFDQQLQWRLTDHILRVYRDDRSCSLMSDDDGIAGSFQCQYGQIASAALDDVIAAVSAWLLARVSVNQLATIVPGLEIELHADVLEIDPARWRWLDLRDNPQKAFLCPSLFPLVEVLATSPIAVAFYTYMSALRLCLSASSHYPWVDGGLPVVAPAGHRFSLQDPRIADRLRVYAVGDGTYEIGPERTDLACTKELIEQALAASPLRPFFGSGPTTTEGR